MYDLYEKLISRKDELHFKLTTEQIQEFNVRMEEIHEIVNAEGSIYQSTFNSNVRRHGVIFFRLCMILSVIRQHESVSDAEMIICDAADFNTALSLISNLLYHANEILTSIDSGKGLSEIEDNILFDLKPKFTRKEAVEIAEKFKVSERTLDDKLKQWRNKKIIKKLSHGKYKRL